MKEIKGDSEEEKLKVARDIKDSFQKILKQGIYKELQQRELLSAEQFNALMKNI